MQQCAQSARRLGHLVVTLIFVLGLFGFCQVIWAKPISCTGSISGKAGVCTQGGKCINGTEEEAMSRVTNTETVYECPDTSWMCCIPNAPGPGGTKPPKTLLPEPALCLGTCRTTGSCLIGETAKGPCQTGGVDGICCNSKPFGDPLPPNNGAVCSISSSSGTQTGVCEFDSLCAGSKVASATCVGGTNCCLLSATGGKPNQGAACNTSSGGTGQCEFTDQCSAGNSVPNPGCFGGTICCVLSSGGSGTGGEGSACNGGNGTCSTIAKCNSNATSQDLCNTGLVCCPNGSTTGGPGTPPSPGGGSIDCSDTTKFQKIAGVCFPKNTGLSEKSVLEIIGTLVGWLFAIFGFIALLGFIISGLQYLFSAGDEGMAETAKRNMKYSMIGIVVALSGWIIIRAIDTLLKANVGI